MTGTVAADRPSHAGDASSPPSPKPARRRRTGTDDDPRSRKSSTRSRGSSLNQSAGVTVDATPGHYESAALVFPELTLSRSSHGVTAFVTGINTLRS